LTKGPPLRRKRNLKSILQREKEERFGEKGSTNCHREISPTTGKSRGKKKKGKKNKSGYTITSQKEEGDQKQDNHRKGEEREWEWA